jgi:secreted Zn-dependent insulinase-like peptidase
MFGAISGLRYDFEQNINDAELVRKISKQELVDYYNEKIMSPKRRKVSVHLVSQKLGDDCQSTGTELNDEAVAAFKARTSVEKCTALAKPIASFIKAAL